MERKGAQIIVAEQKDTIGAIDYVTIKGFKDICIQKQLPIEYFTDNYFFYLEYNNYVSITYRSEKIAKYYNNITELKIGQRIEYETFIKLTKFMKKCGDKLGRIEQRNNSRLKTVEKDVVYKI